MGIAYKYSYVMSLLKRYGFRGLILKTKERAFSPMLKYSAEYKRFLPTDEELEEQRKTYEEEKRDPNVFCPLISIVVPTYETPEKFLRELVDSVLGQSYGNFELVLCDGSNTDIVRETLTEYSDDRIVYHKLLSNEGISENTNRGFERASGDFVALIDHDDIITLNALYEMVKKLREYDIDEREKAIIYSDEDKISGEPYAYSRPHFKPDFNEEFIRRNNYFCHFLMFSKELVKKTGGLNSDFDGAQDFDFVLRCLKEGAIAKHVPKILYHWRIHEGSTAGHSENKSYAFDAGCRAIEAYLKAVGEPGKATTTSNLGVYHVEYDLRENMRDEEYVFVKEGEIIEIEEDTEEKLKKLLSHVGVSAVAPRLIDERGNVISVGVTYDAKGNVADLCGGIPAVYKGYFLHGVIPKDVSALRHNVVLWKKDAYLKYKKIREELSQRGLCGIYLDAASFILTGDIGRFVIDPEVSVTIKRSSLITLDERSDETNSMKTLFAECIKEKKCEYDPCYSPNLKVKTKETYSMKDEDWTDQ
ncbi:MAG: glycosyltransferase [Lachnospiraceae bacterium]|nr:glycosyltransferase [Lachnospiraceae bacterium]